MAITHRKGDYADFDPNKMLPGEIAVVRSGDPKARDGRSIYAAFEAGVVKRMATYEDMVENIEAATDEAAKEVVKQAAAGLLAATESANEAANLANEKASDAQKAAASASSAASSANTAAQQANEAANAANAAAANSRNYEGTLETFPESGSTGILYIDKETGLLYIWETTSGSYMLVGGGSSDNIVFLPYSEFPVNGDPEALYVDTSATDSLKMYRWNGTAYIESKKESGSDIVADAFDEEKDYPVGDYCIKDNVLYKFPNGKEPGPWDDSAAVATTCAEEFKSLYSNCLTYNVETDYFGAYDGNGAWKNLLFAGFKAFYLYANGNEFEDVTGGWNPYAYYGFGSTGGSVKAPKITRKTDSMVINGTAGYYGTVFGENQIDITNYNTLKLKYLSKVVSQAALRIGFTGGRSGGYTGTYTSCNSGEITQEVSLDISGLNGLYYLAILLVGAADVTIYEIKLIS